MARPRNICSWLSLAAFVIYFILKVTGAVYWEAYFTKPIKRMVRVLKSKNAEEEPNLMIRTSGEIQAPSGKCNLPLK